MRARLLLVAALALLAGSAEAAAQGGWRHTVASDHPLVGGIWDVAAGRFIAEDALLARLAAARFVMLGEKHDNVDHHRLQALVVRALAAGGRRPAVGFEMLSTEQAAALDQYLEAQPDDASGLGTAVGWAGSGWPRWSIYMPVAQAAIDAGLVLVAAGLPKERAYAIAREGMEALDATQVRRLGLDEELNPAVDATIRSELRRAHCDKLPDLLIPPMVQIQRARDAVMADNLARGSDEAGADGGVLITGAGHARADHGVPAYLRHLDPDVDVASLAFVEVSRTLSKAHAYAEMFNAGTLPFDFVWFTPRVDDDDPCAQL